MAIFIMEIACRSALQGTMAKKNLQLEEWFKYLHALVISFKFYTK